MINKVLIVDDNQEILITLKEGLEKYEDSFGVVLAGGGEAAVKVLKKKNISLVVTDLKMPKMDGLALLAHIMEHYPDIPVIIITGKAPMVENMTRVEGAEDFFVKPLDTTKFLNRIKEILERNKK